MKNTQTFRNQMNSVRRNVSQSFRHVPLTALMGIVAFGYAAVGYFKNLVTEGGGPFAGLNRGQLRRMAWLHAMYRC